MKRTDGRWIVDQDLHRILVEEDWQSGALKIWVMRKGNPDMVLEKDGAWRQIGEGALYGPEPSFTIHNDYASILAAALGGSDPEETPAITHLSDVIEVRDRLLDMVERTVELATEPDKEKDLF